MRCKMGGARTSESSPAATAWAWAWAGAAAVAGAAAARTGNDRFEWARRRRWQGGERPISDGPRSVNPGGEPSAIK